MELTYTNSKGDTITFGKPDYRIMSIGGLGDVESENQSQKSPYQNGSTYISSVLSERIIPIELKISGIDFNDMSLKRRSLSRVFNPVNGVGMLRLKIGSNTYELETVSDFVPVFGVGPENMGSFYQYCQIQITAHNPYWRSPNETTNPLQAYVGNFKLPMTFPFTLGVSGSSTVLYNDGDVDAPVRIELKGPTTNPQIFNRTTGESIRINRTISEGEKMYINTEEGRQRIVVVDENGSESNAFGFLDHDSTLFNLTLGENEIEHVADAGNRFAGVVVKWDSMFVGV